MKMVLVAEGRVAFVAPGFGVEMEAENKVRPQHEVYPTRPLPDFAAAIKKNFTLPANGLVFQRIIRAVELLARVFISSSLQDFAGRFPEIFGAIRRDRFGLFPHERNASAERAKFYSEHLGDAQRHLAFLDRRGLARFKPAFFHLRPLATDVARIERDL